MSYQYDMNTHVMVGKMENGIKNLKTDEINLKIAESIKRAVGEVTNWTKELKSLVQMNNHVEAFELLNNKKGTIQLLKTEILDDILLINKAVLSKEQRKDFIVVLIVIASREGKAGKTEKIIEESLIEFGDELEPDLKQTLILSKANAAAQNGKMNLANTLYKGLLENKNTDAVSKAYSYRGLALISASQEDILYYHQQGADKFLEIGQKNEAIKDLVCISEMHERDNPTEALKFIDMAINLYDGEKSLDKEFVAGLHHRKGAYLFSLNKINEALETAEIACSLRENLIGNEYERHSSYWMAQTFCEKLGKEEKAIFYSNKIIELTPKITSGEFRLQMRINDAISNKQKISGELLKEIEESNFTLFKFSAYLFNSEPKTSSFEERIEWLDKAKLLLNKKDFTNHHFSLFYFNLAEIYRENSFVEEAIKNYELSLDYNPFYYRAIQNCGAVLWSNKKWEKSKLFFQKQIEKLGESPILCYALGRSYFEIENYQDAFNNFRKADKVKGADISKYISQCLDKCNDLKLESFTADLVEKELPITLESFRETLEQFSQSISTNSRMHFWINKSGTHKWTSCPEEKGKQFLITALAMKYGKKSIDIIVERPVGAGKIDLYIILRGGLKIVVELKICGGSGYSSTYALSGKDQLVHYLKNTDTNIGFLIVFDGRKRDFGKNFKAIQTIENATFFTTAIDMRPLI